MGCIKDGTVYTGVVPTPKKVENLNKDNEYKYELINSSIYVENKDFEKQADIFNSYFLKINNFALKKERGGIEVLRMKT